MRSLFSQCQLQIRGLATYFQCIHSESVLFFLKILCILNILFVQNKQSICKHTSIRKIKLFTQKLSVHCNEYCMTCLLSATHLGWCFRAIKNYQDTNILLEKTPTQITSLYGGMRSVPQCNLHYVTLLEGFRVIITFKVRSNGRGNRKEGRERKKYIHIYMGGQKQGYSCSSGK